MSKEPNRPAPKLPRREFLANLLFAGGALTVTALQKEYGLVARREADNKPADQKDPRDGWELPDEGTPSERDDWELPDDLLEPSAAPRPEPRPKGGMRPPSVRGKVEPPSPPYPGSPAPPRR
jgi:hypothetical protein